MYSSERLKIDYSNRIDMKKKFKDYEAPTVEVWRLRHGMSVLNYLSTGGDVIDLVPGDGELIGDEWDEYVD